MSTYARASIAGGAGIGTAVAAQVKDSNANNAINRDGISSNSARTLWIEGAIVRSSAAPTAASSGRGEMRVVDAERAQSLHRRVEFLFARERPHADAMQRAIVARQLVETRELDAVREQHLDPA